MSAHMLLVNKMQTSIVSIQEFLIYFSYEIDDAYMLLMKANCQVEGTGVVPSPPPVPL